MVNSERTIEVRLSRPDRRILVRIAEALEALEPDTRPRTIFHNYRSAETGEFVTKDFAESNPSTTVKET